VSKAAPSDEWPGWVEWQRVKIATLLRRQRFIQAELATKGDELRGRSYLAAEEAALTWALAQLNELGKQKAAP
jgi:hypothetical protein